MTARLEPLVYVALLAILSVLVAIEGRKRVELERQLPLEPQELYRTLARSQTRWQVVDVRTFATGYEESHVPGAIPLPGCDPASARDAASERILRSAPTVLVSEHGDEPEVKRCLATFSAARILAGGMASWSEAGLPEDTGEYTPPSMKAGGGCL